MKHRVFSGARPTGRQHLGNYLGAIQNYVNLQEKYECVYCIVDIHALTTLEDTGSLQKNIYDMMLDWLSAGLDPKKSILFVQSHVPEVMELHTLLGMVTPLGWLLRVPTFKDKARLQPQNINYGLVGYPVLMTADIVLYKGEVVPVGEDQLPHLELAREITRRFNNLFGDTFPEPTAKLTSFPLILGLNGKEKMSNPGHPEVCNIYKLQEYFSPLKTSGIAEQCRTAKIGCVECKKILAQEINLTLKPFRERRAALANNPKYVADVLADGAERARVIARETLREVKQKMGLT